MLASMGSAAAVEAAGFPRVSAVSTNWDGKKVVHHDPRAQGMLVDRGVFDAALLARAAAVGVRVLHPAHVRHHARTPDGWHLHANAEGKSIDLHATFLAFGSGRATRLGGRRHTMGPRTFAIYGYWIGTHLPEHPRIEAGEREWYWGVPIPDGSYNTLVFLDADRFRAEPRGSLDDRLRALLEQSALMRDVRGATLRAPARAVDATPYLDDECVGTRHIRIGDAGLAIDPLSSSGVQKAIQTALSGAIVANTLLRRSDARDAALRFYRSSLREAATRHRAWASSHYAAVAARFHDPFWTTRAGTVAPAALDGAPAVTSPNPTIADDIPVQLSSDSKWEELPCLGIQYVEIKSALRHPRLHGPIAYVGGHELAPLLRDVRPGMTSRQLVHAWSGSLPTETGIAIARWLSSHGVLERCTAPRP